MENLDEKTLTPNEVAKKEEIVKSLKKKKADFVKRYGADRAKGVMYATATKVAKAVTEESTDESFSIHGSGSNFDSAGFEAHMKKLKAKSQESNAAQEVAKMVAQKDYEDRVKKTSADRAAKSAGAGGKLITDPFHYSQGVNIKTEDVDAVCKLIQREHLIETGELLTLNQIKESDSAIDGSDKGPISRASAKHGRIKPMSGTKTIASKIATILAKKA